MGAGLGACCLGEAACCVGTQAISCCGRALQCGGKIGYPIVLFIGTLLSIVFRFFLIDQLDTILKHVGGSSVCAGVTNQDAKNACYGNQFVYRIGFAMVLFFSTMFLLVICFRKAAHDGAWCMKVLYMLGIFIASLWITDDHMANFAAVCLGGAGIFIVVQVLQLLEWAYGWNESWRAQAEEDPVYFKYLLWTAVTALIIALVFVVLAIVQFGHGGCSFAIGEITWTVIAVVCFSVLSIVKEEGSLLTSSLVAVYCCYYCWSALSGMDADVKADSGTQCNSLLSSDGSGATTVNVIIGLCLTCFSMAIIAYSSETSDLGITKEHTASGRQAGDEEQGGEYEHMSGEGEENATDVIKTLMLHHFVNVLCTMFMVMTIVNWDIDVATKSVRMEDFGTGQTVVWVKTVSQWLTIVLYAWTLIAKDCFLLCGIERDFDFT